MLDGLGFILMVMAEERPPKYVHPKCREEAEKLVRDYLEKHEGWRWGFMGAHYDWLLEFAEWLSCARIIKQPNLCPFCECPIEEHKRDISIFGLTVYICTKADGALLLEGK